MKSPFPQDSLVFESGRTGNNASFSECTSTRLIPRKRWHCGSHLSRKSKGMGTVQSHGTVRLGARVLGSDGCNGAEVSWDGQMEPI